MHRFCTLAILAALALSAPLVSAQEAEPTSPPVDSTTEVQKPTLTVQAELRLHGWNKGLVHNWEGGEPLSICAFTGLLQQGKTGSYTLTGHITTPSHSRLTRNVSWVLVGPEGIVGMSQTHRQERQTDVDLEYSARQMAHPTSSDFTRVCGELVGRKLVFEEIPTTVANAPPEADGDTP